MARNENNILETTLNPQNIDSVSEQCAAFCSSFKLESKQVQRIRLTVEECLLAWLDCFGADIPLKLEYGYHFGKPYLIIRLNSGNPFNPFEDDSSDGETYSRSLLTNMGLSPEYSYHSGTNILHFRLKKPPANQLKVLGLVILASILVGILGRELIPEHIIQSILEGFVDPVCDKLFSILSCIAGPMIFLSVAWGIYGIGDTASLNKIGKKMIFRYIGVVFLVAALGTLAFPVLGPGLSDSSAGEFTFGGLFQMFLDILPDNIFSPFIDCNTLQIIFLAVVIGIVLLFLEKQTSSVARAIEQINHMVQFLMGIISKMIPFFIFIVLVQMIWSGAVGIILNMTKLALVVVVCFALLEIAVTLVVGIRRKANPFMLLR